MATQWELKQQAAAKKAQERKLIGAVAGSIIELAVEAGPAAPAAVGSANILATVINVVGNLGIAAWQFLSMKKAAKKKERLQRKQQIAQDSVGEILATIQETGQIVVEEHGIDPTTPEFEKILYDNLFESVGYRGNCNARVWMPGSKPGPRRPVWFIVEGNGRKIIPTPNFVNIPPNFQQYWHSTCKNFKDDWISTYRDMLIQQGRLEELADFEEAHASGTKYLRIGFGIVIAITLFFIIRNMTRIK